MRAADSLRTICCGRADVRKPKPPALGSQISKPHSCAATSRPPEVCVPDKRVHEFQPTLAILATQTGQASGFDVMSRLAHITKDGGTLPARPTRAAARGGQGAQRTGRRRGSRPVADIGGARTLAPSRGRRIERTTTRNGGDPRNKAVVVASSFSRPVFTPSG